MAIWDGIISKLSQRLVSDFTRAFETDPVIQARAYREGYYRPQLKVRSGQFDDNIGLNYCGLVVDRIVSQMLGKGFTLDFDGDTETAQEQWIKAVFEANKQEVLFHNCAESATIAGTGYLFIIPDGLTKGDATYPRLHLIDPATVKMDTLPEDYEVVIRYTITYKYTVDGKEKARKREIEHNAPETLADGTLEGGNTWTIRDYESNTADGGRWNLVSEVVWPYPFPPVLHWQNQPNPFSPMGKSDIPDSLIDLQDRTNFTASNISKLIRYYAHPMRIAKNVGEMKAVEVGADKMVQINGTDSEITQLDPLGDLASSLAFQDLLTKALFSTARVVDLRSYEDKLGSLTNFGLRVLYQDNLSMIDTKRELFGDMLAELVSRLLQIAGQEDIPCTVVWPDFLPVNETEETTAMQSDLGMGIASKQTIADKRGYDWEQEQERLENERAGEDNIGNALLKAFNQGQGGNNF